MLEGRAEMQASASKTGTQESCCSQLCQQQEKKTHFSAFETPVWPGEVVQVNVRSVYDGYKRSWQMHPT